MEEIPVYKFWNEKWISAESLTEKDIALLINKDNKTIYVWDGTNSNPRTQIVAKEALGEFKIEFPDYKFRLLKSVDKGHGGEKEDRGIKGDKGDKGDMGAVPEYISKTLKLTLKDDTKVRLDIRKNYKKMDKIIHLLAIMSVSLLLIVIGRFLSLIANGEAGSNGTETTMFDTNLAFSEFMSSNMILLLLASFIMIALLVLSLQMGLYERSLFILIGIISLYLTVFYFWGEISTEMLELNADAPFIIHGGFFNDFALYSVLVVGIILFSLIIGIYLYKGDKHNNKKGKI